MPITQQQIDAQAESVVPPQQMLVGGRWCEAEDGQRLDIGSPIDGQRLTSIASASGRDVDLAVGAAQRAFESGVWASESPSMRKQKLLRLADLIEARALEITVLGVRDNGTEIQMAQRAELESCVACFRYYAETIDKLYGEVAPTAEQQLGLVMAEPVGVVGVIIPWNFPLMIGSWKVAPALATGNSVVLKPSEQASLSWLQIAELALQAGIPEGVFNVVTGKGSVVGEALGLHAGVDLIAFTGGGAVGARLHEYSAQSNLKRLYLELGGKSANIIFDDVADLDQCVAASIKGIFRNSGQVCVAGSRLLVQRSIMDAVLEKLVAGAEALRVGNPLELTTDVGAVNNAGQLAGNLQFVQRAQADGFRLLTGGGQIHRETGGFYMQPTVIADVHPDSELAQKEVFGPVLAVIPFADEAEAVAIANHSVFGLAAGLWTENLSRAHRVSRLIRSGVVHVNCYGGTDLTIPMGGMKQSGNGYDRSLRALDKYLNYKSVWISL